MNEFELREHLKEKLRGVTLDTLPAFIAEAMDREHDYGSICVAIGAVAAAAAHAANQHPNGGITGFQAGAVFWEFTRAWGTFEDGPKRMMQYANMLYPQYDRDFDKTITPDTWKWMQDEAAKKLAEGGMMHPDVRAHMEAITHGVVPFGYQVRGG